MPAGAACDRMKQKGSRRSQGEGWAWIRACPTCGRDPDGCRCRPTRRSAERGRLVVRLRIEKRRGKPVTVCDFEGLAGIDLRPTAKELKTLCGTGGTVKGNEVELQGDHRQRVRPFFRDRGYTVKG